MGFPFQMKPRCTDFPENYQYHSVPRLCWRRKPWSWPSRIAFEQRALNLTKIRMVLNWELDVHFDSCESHKIIALPQITVLPMQTFVILFSLGMMVLGLLSFRSTLLGACNFCRFTIIFSHTQNFALGHPGI